MIITTNYTTIKHGITLEDPPHFPLRRLPKSERREKSRISNSKQKSESMAFGWKKKAL